jgi:ribosomal protein S21
MSVNVTVFVKNADIFRALKGLKRKYQNEGIGLDITRTTYFVRPGERANLKRSKAQTRARKLAAKLGE